MTVSTEITGISKQTKNELLERRMLVFAVTVIRTLQQFPAMPRSMTDQLTRSSASIGANYAEACNAVSRQDFRNKIFIAKKEAAESRYWIDLAIELTDQAAWQWCRQEVQELLLILQKIVSTLKENSDK